MDNMIAYCGLDCARCGAYLAMKNDDQALREKTAAEWTEKFQFNFTPEMINCVGCKGEGLHMGYCSQCLIRKCASEKGVENCGACGEFETCKDINDFLAQVPCARKNLVQE